MTDEQNPEEMPLPATQADAAARYHAPPESIPREAMWNAIQAQRTRRASVDVSAVPTVMSRAAVPASPVAPSPMPVTVIRTTRGALGGFPRWRAAAVTAAVLAIAFGVLRRAPQSPDAPAASPPVLTAADSVSTAIAWQTASAEHFGLAESMLTTLSTSPNTQGDKQLTAWSRDLLESTRLLMDSPAGRDAKQRALLAELELVLVQLVESGPAIRTEDRSVMDDVLSRSALLLTRIRTTVPAGLPASRN